MRHRVTRRLTRLQTMYNVLKYHKNMVKERQHFNLPEPQRNRTRTANFVNLIMTISILTIYAMREKSMQKAHVGAR